LERALRIVKAKAGTGTLSREGEGRNGHPESCPLTQAIEPPLTAAELRVVLRHAPSQYTCPGLHVAGLHIAGWAPPERSAA
jgi:hypothetical protein